MAKTMSLVRLAAQLGGGVPCLAIRRLLGSISRLSWDSLFPNVLLVTMASLWSKTLPRRTLVGASILLCKGRTEIVSSLSRPVATGSLMLLWSVER
jgi:hypothetical protein